MQDRSARLFQQTILAKNQRPPSAEEGRIFLSTGFCSEQSRPCSSGLLGKAPPITVPIFGCIDLMKEARMHDLLIGLAYVSMAFGPAVLASIRTLDAEKDA
jgi:hypothetical protein